MVRPSSGIQRAGQYQEAAMSSEPNIANENESTDPDGCIVSKAMEKLGGSTPTHAVHNIESGEDRQQRIATAAYYRAERRGFNSGDAIQDWLEAEADIDMDMETIFPIKIDMTETDKDYTFRAKIPGVKKEDVKIQVDGNLVSISAEVKHEKEEKEGVRVVCRECYQRSSYRSFLLDCNVDEAKAQAKCENGILELILPKRNVVKIEIKWCN
jgi:HSP20 family protein